jgi:AcrR family transcriptional regulator
VVDARKERWRAHREVRRAEFVEATIRAVSRYGPDVGMDRVAAEAGVTKPVLYRHFTDKADLYVAVGARATDLLMAKVVPALAEDDPIFERIRRAVGCYVTFVDEYRELYRFLVMRPNPVKRDIVQEDKSKIAEVLTELLAAYLRLFRMDPAFAGPSAHGIVGLVQGAVEWWLEQGGLTRDQLTEHLTTMIWHGIDGVLRAGGVTLDPHKPVSFASQLKLIVGGEA